MRLITILTLLTVAVVPTLARAQAVPPAPTAPSGECTTTTTTTVHCTGDAAPYGAQPAGVAPAPPVYPPNSYPPNSYPLGAYPLSNAASPYYVNPRLFDDGWKLVQEPNGSIWRERNVHAGSPALWGSGLALWLSTWVAASAYSFVDSSQGVPGLPMLPMLGSFIQAAAVDGNGSKAFYAITGLTQTAGFVMFLVGLSVGPEKCERLPVMVGVAPTLGGGVAGLSGHF